MPAPERVAPGRGLAGALRSRTALLLVFSFAVMADPVSSVAYAIEAALRALNGDLALLVPTMGLVVAIIALVILNYRLVILVGAVTWFGHLGRLVFAAMTVGFILVSALVLFYGLGAAPQPVGTITDTPGHPPVIAVVLAFPVAMALATGVEAPSSAIAQLGQLDDAGRSRFGRVTLWLTLAIVGSITLGLTLEAAHLQVGIPPADSTQIAELARLAAPGPVFAAFQLVTALLLLSAASSSFQAGPVCSRPSPATPTDRAIPSASFLPRWDAQTPTTLPAGGWCCSSLWPALSPPPQPAASTRNSCSFTLCQFS